MAEKEDKRVKFCRYCDGLIEFGTKVCPHCGESLEIVDFEEMDFVQDSPRGFQPGRAAPRPVVQPIGDAPPTVQPVGKKPPVVKPIPGKPPVVKPVRGQPPRRAPAPRKKGPPVVKPVRAAPPPAPSGPPVVQPMPEEPPVAQPIGSGDDPPMLAPIGAPPPGGLPAGVAPLLDCPVCEAEMESPSDVGGVCDSCGESVCVACLMRANGLKVAASSESNHARWGEHVARAGARKIRCPACGRTGVK